MEVISCVIALLSCLDNCFIQILIVMSFLMWCNCNYKQLSLAIIQLKHDLFPVALSERFIFVQGYKKEQGYFFGLVGLAARVVAKYELGCSTHKQLRMLCAIS